MWDSLILMMIALVVFGPRRLPQIGRQIGKLMYEFRKASNDFKFQMEEELRNSEEADRRKKEEERLKALALTAPAATEVGSQVSEARNFDELSAGSGAPETVALPAVQSAAAVMESNYPAETQYPSTAAEAPIDPPLGEEAYPRIQPPSTGEQVAAAKPTSRVAHSMDGSGTEVSIEARGDSDLASEAALLPGADELRANKSGLNTGGGPIPDKAQAAQHG
jgi:sec-independent protein translocase protein TatB